MKAFPAWLSYSILRLLLMVVPFAILMLLRVPWWLSAIAAAIIGLCLSYIFLQRSRDAVARQLYEARHSGARPSASSDDETEDAAVDAATERPSAE